jgi:two-component system response regulator QseB
MRILVVEDDRILGEGLVTALGLEGFAADWVQTRLDAQEALATNSEAYALVILDIGLPDGSGLDVLKSLREKDNPLPVLMLTAYDTVPDRIRGLDYGADDYLIKPFDLGELLARVRSLRRRSAGKPNPLLQLGTLTLDPAARRVTKDGVVVDLGPKELTILHYMIEKPDRVVSKTQLEDALYGWDSEVESNTVEVHVHGLRKKLGKEIIRTIRGVGYVMDSPAPARSKKKTGTSA